MIISLDEAKTWLRIDGNEDDSIILMLINSAEAYLKNATGKEYSDNNSHAKLICLVLVTDWFENREFVGKADNVRHTIKSMLMQLEYGSETNENI